MISFLLNSVNSWKTFTGPTFLVATAVPSFTSELRIRVVQFTSIMTAHMWLSLVASSEEGSPMVKLWREWGAGDRVCRVSG